jgi:CHAT domain-containing protein/tetratricopeptide (TPR) repeat protein
LLFIGSCQKAPPQSIQSPLSTNYNAAIQAAYQAKSIPKLLELKQEIEKLKGYDDTLALAYRRIGNVYYQLGQLDKMFLNTKMALTILQKYQKANPSDIAKCELNIGICYLFKGDLLDSAALYLKRALPLFQQLKDVKNIFNTQNQLLRLHIKREDYEQANLIEQNIKEYVNHSELDNGILKDWYSNLGLKALAQLEDDVSKASIYKPIVISNYNKVIDYLKKQQNEKEIAAIWANMGVAYLHSQAVDNAKVIFNKALIVFKQENETVNEAKCLNNLAMCYAPQQPAMVKKLLLKADKLLITHYKNKAHIDRTELYSNLGNLDFNKKNYLQAAANYQTAIEQACSGNADYLQQLAQQKKFQFNAPNQLLYPLQRKAEALFQQYLLDKKVDHLLKSLKIYETLDDYITRTRGLMTADESKFAYSEKVVSLYEKALLTAIAAYKLDSKQYADYILRFMAHSKAAVLQESIQQDTAKRLANVSKTASDEEQSLKWEVAKARTDLSKADSAQQASAYRALLDATENWERFIKRLELEYPIYYQSKYSGLKVLKINQLQNYLTEDRAIIDFFWGQKTLYTATITKNSFKMDTTAITPLLQSQIKNWVAALHADILNNSIKAQLTQYSYPLYQQLLEKPVQNLPSNQVIQRLTIIPDGVLNLLPFEALSQKPIPHGDSLLQKSTIAQLLVSKYAMSYAYSNTLLFGAPQAKREAPQDLGGFGINYEKEYENEDIEKKASGRLRKAEKDVVDAQQWFSKSKIWTESTEDAHLKSFYKNAPDCRILYLSMHGVLDDSFPLKSGLLFTWRNRLQLLQLSDIQGLSLPYNDLTILSACNTSLGKESKGEGLISLSRAFSFTGTKSLLTTRWSLEENAGSAIIGAFLKYIKAGLPKDIALQKAKQDYLNKPNQTESLLSPNFWAATVLVGDIDCLELSSAPNRCWIWLLFLLMAIAFGKWMHQF